MVSQQSYDKARSIQHCRQLVGKNAAGVEREYDDQCQIHVNKNEAEHHIKIFSKSSAPIATSSPILIFTLSEQSYS
jgi:DNA ligase 4